MYFNKNMGCFPACGQDGEPSREKAGEGTMCRSARVMAAGWQL